MDLSRVTAALNRWFAGARARILAASILLLAISTLASILFMREILHTRLDEEINTQFRQEAGEFRRLVGGRDPRTGEPFGSDVRSIFDVYFSRNVPDEGEALISLLGERVYKTKSAAGARIDPAEFRGLIADWAGLRRPQAGRIDTDRGPLLYLALPVGTSGPEPMATFVVANFPAEE